MKTENARPKEKTIWEHEIKLESLFYEYYNAVDNGDADAINELSIAIEDMQANVY